MRYYVTLDGREVEVEIRENGGRMTGVLDGKEYAVDCSVIEPASKYSVLIDQESLNVTVNPGTSSLDMIIGGCLYRTQVLDERERGALELEQGRKSAGLGIVKSVMPGIVRKIFVAEGDQVDVGAPLLILEAMKMENEIAAEGEGTVTKIHIEEGKAVNSNDPLITIG
jgi:biotin carboxyl carrier protein